MNMAVLPWTVLALARSWHHNVSCVHARRATAYSAPRGPLLKRPKRSSQGPLHINTMIVDHASAVSQLQLDGRVRVGSLRTWYSRRETPDARTIPCFPGVIYYHVPLHNTSGGATRRQAHDGSARICSSVARAASAAASLSIAAGSCNAIMLVASSPASKHSAAAPPSPSPPPGTTRAAIRQTDKPCSRAAFSTASTPTPARGM